MKKDTKFWAAALHISQLAGHFIPLAGFVIPLIIWQVKKADFPELELHGRQVANWIVSILIYYAIGFGMVLVLFFIFPFLIFLSFPILICTSILGLVFPIIAAIKASDGEVWQYPLAIAFF